MVENELNDARHEVLAENTAQAVQKHLSKLFQEESRFRSRWVWELLQNARDASPEEGVGIGLIHELDSFVFKHNGLPFTQKSIAHLIYHGSTKYDLSDSAIGKFGTGFLTTHLISKTVEVKGKTDDGRHFHFLLDRRGTSADELKNAMDKSWDAFTESLAEDAGDEVGCYTTEYRYHLTDNMVADAVAEGIGDLITNAGYLFAFNGKIKSLHVEQPSRITVIGKKDWETLAEVAQCLHIEERAEGSEPVSRYLATIANNGSLVAVEIAKSGANWSIVKEQLTPRIFVAFPLTGTRDFCLPVVINNEKFQPREERDTLVLKQNRDGKTSNMEIMEECCDLAMQLVVLAAEEVWDGATALARLNPISLWDWIDADWFRILVKERFIQPLRLTKLMTTTAGARIPPVAGMIPWASDTALCDDLWDVTSQIKGELSRLPLRSEAGIWSDNLTSWAPFLSIAIEQISESLTIEKLCERVATWGTLDEVEKQLVNSDDAIEWLNQLHSLISKGGHNELFERIRLIPSQSGVLKKITELRRDPGIDEELKDIAESLGMPTRDDLLDQRMCLRELLELKPKPGEEILTVALQKLKEKAKFVETAFGSIAIRFFVWLMRHNHSDKLDGLPVLTRATTGEEAFVTILLSDPAKTDERLLAPVGFWPEQARLVADLFPKRHTLSDAYYDALPDDVFWKRIETDGYVRLSPLYSTRRRGIPFIPSGLVAVSDKVKHRTKEGVDVSALAYFEREETGLDLVRRSKIRAVTLLGFLANYVLEYDAGALDVVEAECECGENHLYCRAAWIVPMLERRWVPLGDSKQSFSTAESLAQLFDGKEQDLRQITAGKGRKLLDALGISLADLSMRAVAKDEDTRISLIDSLADIVHAANNDAEKVKLVAEEIKRSPGLIDEIREHRERREKVLRNQALGAEVERLLKEALEDGHGLKVTPTGVGSDYEVEEDYLVDSKEVLLTIEGGRKSFLIEVKATVGSVARMTVKQAETAVANKSRFILCMVRLDSPEPTPEIVRERCRFVMDIGDQIEPVWKEYCKYQATKDKVCAAVGDVELIVQESEVRFAVGEGAWEGGSLFNVAVENILIACLVPSPA